MNTDLNLDIDDKELIEQFSKIYSNDNVVICYNDVMKI